MLPMYILFKVLYLYLSNLIFKVDQFSHICTCKCYEVNLTDILNMLIIVQRED